jgi:hypothetical protein
MDSMLGLAHKMWWLTFLDKQLKCMRTNTDIGKVSDSAPVRSSPVLFLYRPSTATGNNPWRSKLIAKVLRTEPTLYPDLMTHKDRPMAAKVTAILGPPTPARLTTRSNACWRTAPA